MSFTIRQLQPSEWAVLKAVRLKALQTDPSVFGSNYQKESLMSDADWQEWLTGRDGAIFCIFEGDRPVGMTGVKVDRHDPTGKNSILWGSWLESHVRGQGVSVMMYEARINWAKNHPVVEKVVVAHRETNLASKFANQKHGFIFTSRNEHTWPDNTVEDQLHYELLVKPSS